MTDPEIARLVASLARTPVATIAASVPREDGLYAWWARPQSLSDADPPIPEVGAGLADWSLLYVGIAPNSRTSKGNLARRIEHDHRLRSIGQSTFRQSLAALLRICLALEPQEGHDRSRLVDEAPLTAWIERNCAITFVARESPWQVERPVSAVLGPPLSIAHGTHPFRHEVSRARDRLRRDCGL